MGYAFHSVALGQLLSLPELGTFTGTGEIKGAGFSVETLKSDFYLQIDTLGFKAYNYKGVLLVGALGQGEYELNMVAKDSSLKGELKVVLTLADSAVIVDASGVMMAQLNELHFYNDTLAIETAVEAHLAMRGMELESKISTTGTTFTTPRESATVQQLTATFRTDKVESVLHAEADFFHVDMHLMRPLNELKSLGNEFKDYFVSFRDPSHITTADRLSALPEINAMGQIYPNDILDIFLEDSGIHFTNLDFSITCKPEEDRLNAYIQGGEMAYKSLKTGKLNAAITDSAGIILLEILAEKSSFNSGPENRIKLAGEFSNRSTLTTLSVDDSTNQNVYFIEVAGKADSSKIVLEIPSQQLTLNRVQWQMESPDLLSIDLATGTVSPTLRINRDSSFMHVHTLNQNQILSYRVDLNKVELGSLLRRGLFPGRPDGTFTGSVDYSASMDSEKKIAAGLHISDIRYSQQDFSDIQLDGSLILGQPDAYSIDLLAKMDSSYVQLTGGKVESGDRSIKAEFSHFPLITIQPFTEEYLSELGGFISGKFNISSVKGSEQANGELNFKDASVKVNILNNTFKIPSQRIQLTDERVVFSDFTVLDTLNKKLHVDGFVDFGGTNPVSADLNISSSKLKVMSRDKKSRAPFTGNVFVDSRFSVKGPLTNPRVEGRILLAEGTEIFYQQREDLRMSESERIVNFVSHNETGEEIKPPTIIRQSSFMNSGIETIVEIDPSTRINFTLDNRMFSIDLDVKGGGEVQYDMLKNEQVTLSGKYVIGEGAALINLVGWPNKSFQLTKGGYIRWDGRVENPELNFEAENTVSSSYINPVDGKRRDVKFNVILQMTGYLTDLNVLFTIRTPDQYVMSILNTMSPEEKMRQAISVLLFEAIDLPGISSSTDYMTQQVNQILASQLNQLTKSTIKGVDISFGLNSYDQSSQQGGSEPSTSLSYEVRKSLLNNRGQIEVSGRLHDLNQGLGASDHSLTNVSFEYRLDSTANKFLKVYNEHTYDDVFEGEVTKTGIGFTYRKRYRSFREIWKHKK
jgi:translocation and assembly module TamB